MIITRTPFRISFFGGGTDYPVWYRENPGAVLSTTINKYCYINTRYLPPFFPYKFRIRYTTREETDTIEQIKHPSVRECINFMGVENGIEMVHTGDIPAQSGMGSSSAFTVGFLHSLYALLGRMVSKRQLAREAIHIEQNIIKENVGSQDQVASAFGGLNKIEFGKQIKETPNRKKELEAMLEMVGEGIDILSSPGRDIDDFGKLLNESWKLKRFLTDKITTPHIDEMYNAAMAAGAEGGKLLGAGGGGFLLIFADPEIQPKIKAALDDLLYVPFSFETLGTQVVHYAQQEL